MVEACFYEIYNEKVNDLLNMEGRDLKVFVRWRRPSTRVRARAQAFRVSGR